MAAEFLQQLHDLPQDDLPNDSCMICFRQYGTIQSTNETIEAAVRLPCGHVIGSQCIATWLAPANGKNTCPFCRRVLFDVPLMWMNAYLNSIYLGLHPPDQVFSSPRTGDTLSALYTRALSVVDAQTTSNAFNTIDAQTGPTLNSTSPTPHEVRATRAPTPSEHLTMSTAEQETSYAPPSPTRWPNIRDEQPSSPIHVPSASGHPSPFQWLGMETVSSRRPARQQGPDARPSPTWSPAIWDELPSSAVGATSISESSPGTFWQELSDVPPSRPLPTPSTSGPSSATRRPHTNPGLARVTRLPEMGDMQSGSSVGVPSTFRPSRETRRPGMGYVPPRRQALQQRAYRPPMWDGKFGGGRR